MIGFDLKCKLGHVFEAWFKDENIFERQLAEKHIGCVICGDSHIEYLAKNEESTPDAAPKLESELEGGIEGEFQLDSLQDTFPVMPVVARGKYVTHCAHIPDNDEVTADDVRRALDHMYQTMAQYSRQAQKTSTYVGTEFARQVREMQGGDREPSPIHGELTMDEREELLEDGIDLLPVPALGKLNS